MDKAGLTALKPKRVIDARWTPCPGPLLEAKDGIGHLKEGDVLEIRSHDPGAPGDISAWARKTGHEFLGFITSQGCDRIFIRKKNHL
ncbi:putative redox protein, regulator of disulfide bond formation [Desulfomonile tiedjei DSM 6799]|uniref:Putative redox protein, regulator of disulfide bond formation n=2 Tax=Desulfomonile tiedjei TaxID=2358 RepID=I4CD87_DESTA|nr:putative redox protein, regulator of disulfide bond formation [Desulfomonile tiedjei DSM 6799]